MKRISILKHNLMRTAMTLALIVTCAMAWAETVETYYIDENGTRHDVTATVLTGTGVLTANQWYVVNSDVNISNSSEQIRCNGNLNLILADGKTFTISSSNTDGIIDSYGNTATLSIYGQENGTGTLKVTATGSSGNAIYAYSGVNIVGCNVTAISNGASGISTIGNITISGGQVSATGGSGYNGLKSSGTITLGWTNYTDFINASSYSANGSVAIATGKTLYDGATGYTNTLSDQEISNIGGKTLRPYSSNDFSVNDAGTEYTIHNATGWDVFCDYIVGGESFNGKTVKLGADITITRMAGSNDKPFSGTFEGQGLTLTLNYGSADNPIDAEFVAPFVYTTWSTSPIFRNLTIAGHIYSTYTCNDPEPHPAHTGTGGLIGHLYGTVTIEHCMSNVEITVTGEQYASGFVGLCEHTVNFNDCMSSAVIHSAGGNNSGFVAWSRASDQPYNINFTGCVFNGKLLQINGQGNSNGGFIGWTGATKIVSITNCLYAPAALAEGEAYASYNSATFARGWQEHCSETNSYYTTAFGAAQGKQAHSITAGNFVTAANAGTATAYATSGITGYGTGIKYNDVLYAGSGESVGLTISNTVPASFNFTGYSVTDGASLNGSGNDYTLTMPNAEVDVVITANYTIPSVSYIDENGAAQTCTYYYPLEGTETTLGTAGQETWYVAQPGTLNYSQGIQLLGNTHIILCDGAALNIGTSDSPVSGDGFYCNGVYDLSVYTQSGNTGALAIYSSQCPFVVNNLTLAGGNVNTTSYYDANCNNLTVCRSTLGISASSGSAIYALGDVTFSYVTATTNGSITCANTNFAVDHSQLTVNATNMTAIQTSGGNVTLSYVTADITSSNYQGFYCSSFAVDNSQLTVTAYYEAINALGGVITLGCTAATDFIKATRTDGYINSSYSGTVKIADGQTLYAGGNAYTGTLTDAERQAIGGQKLTNVAPPTYDYIDINGTGATHAAVVIDADNMPTSLSGWYIVQGTVNYTSMITLAGETHIILADGAVMNVTTTLNYGINGTNGNPSLFVYGQSGQSGQLNVTSNRFAIIIVQGDIAIAGGIVTATSMSTSYIAIYAVVGDITITGCEVEATGGTGIFAENYSNNGGGNVTIQNATVTATTTSTGYTGAIRSYNGGITINNSNVTAMGTARYGIYAEYSGNILLNGGKITATGNNYGIYAENGNITLGWTNPTDYIYANSYSTNGTLTLTKTFIDEDGHTYSGTIAMENGTYPIDGKTLYPYISGAIFYLDENGQRRLCAEYTTLEGTETTLGTEDQETWYVADNTLNFTNPIMVYGHVHLILKDNAVMNVGTEEHPIDDYQGIGIIEDFTSLSIYAQSTGADKGQLNVNVDYEYDNFYAKGISVSEDLTINGGQVTVNANGNYTIGISSNGSLTINGGQVTVNANGNSTNGISSDGSLTINGGQVTVNANGNQSSYGISSNGSLTINGGQVTVNANGNQSSYGISSDGSLTINGGQVTNVNGNNIYGINSTESLTINGGQVTANGLWGIYTLYGNVTIEGGQVEITGGEYGIVASNITLSWTNPTDYIYANSYFTSGTLSLTKTFKDEDGHTYSGTIASVNGTYSIDGKTLRPEGVIIKQVIGYGNSTESDHWVFIASPVAGSIAPTNVHNLLGCYDEATEKYDYDLYRFNQRVELEWQNYNNLEHTAGFNLVNGQGYLYATKETRTLVFAGTPYSGDGIVPLIYETTNTDPNMWGWNLIGNPFAQTASVDCQSFYVMNTEGSEIEPAETSTVAPMEGIIVHAAEVGLSVTFTPASSKGHIEKPEPDQVVLNLSRNGGSVIDRAIVRMGEGQTLPKFQIRENSTKLYIPQNGKDYAIVSVGNMGEIPVNFRANKNGTFTLTISETINSQLSTINYQLSTINYLHLIDNMTGADVDLLQTPEYTFNAKVTDYESRFKLVFACGDANDGSDSFAFISNGNLIVNGTGTLQVIDVNGRVVLSGDAKHCVSTNGMTSGVYVLRLIDGEDVRTQKIVVR